MTAAENLPIDPYPSIDELIPQVMYAKLPAALALEIADRYQTLGGKYQTMYQHTDGRFINGMMFTDRIQNCLEEVVDGVFCLLGDIFRYSAAGIEPTDNIYTILDGLIQVYSLLVVERELRNAPVV